MTIFDGGAGKKWIKASEIMAKMPTIVANVFNSCHLLNSITSPHNPQLGKALAKPIKARLWGPLQCKSRRIKAAEIRDFNVRYWHKAVIPVPRVNVAFGGKADMAFCDANVCF